MNQQLFDDARIGYTARIIPINLPNNQAMSEWTPLHIACLFGKVFFAGAFLQENPRFLKLVNPDGCTALHLASSNGNLEMVNFLLTFDLVAGQSVHRDHCMKKDHDGRTPLHHAVIKGRTEVVKKLLTDCPESSLEVTVQKETVFHLAVKNKIYPSVEVFTILLQGPYTSHLLNLTDKKGNTVLHLASARKQIKIIRLLTTGERNLDVNAVNSSGLTPLDLVAVDPMNFTDAKIERMIISAGGIRLNESNEQRENLKSITSGLLVMASLSAAAGCQIAVYLQGGFWKDSILKPGDYGSSISNSTNALEKPWNATLYNQDDVKKINKQYNVLVISDGVVFFSSLLLIVILLFPTPTKHNRLRWISLRIITYLNAWAFIFLLTALEFYRGKGHTLIWWFLPAAAVILFLIALPFNMRMPNHRCIVHYMERFFGRVHHFIYRLTQ